MRKLFIIPAIIISFTSTTFAQKKDSVGKPSIITLKESALFETPQPLVIIDGSKQVTKGSSSLSGIDPNSISSIEILKDSAAIALYGNEGANGVIIISTKGKSGVAGSSFHKLPNDGSTSKISGLTLRPNSNHKSYSLKDSASMKLRNSKIIGQSHPLYIVDGEEMPDYYNSINFNPNDIASITVLKDATSLLTYGSKGKDGVILISTKKAKTTLKKN